MNETISFAASIATFPQVGVDTPGCDAETPITIKGSETPGTIRGSEKPDTIRDAEIPSHATSDATPEETTPRATPNGRVLEAFSFF